MVLGDFGHQRASNKPQEHERLVRAIRDWFAHHLMDAGPSPRHGVSATTQLCPDDGPVGRTYRAPTFGSLSGHVRRDRFPGPVTITSDGGDPAVAAAIDPVGGGGDGCVQTQRSQAPGTSRHLLKEAGSPGLTLVGAPRLGARIAICGAEPGVSQLVARLWDVSPDGETQRLVARGLYRPRDGRNRWELHPAAWRFKRGHAAELELLGTDAPFARPSNGAFQLEVENLRVRLPTR